ncbi:MAG: PepSY domain-containing protein [Gammaproteobacteria bacterium]|nr:PepSY domain-containing protein [Gammaproteobacteria bacterium]
MTAILVMAMLTPMSLAEKDHDTAQRLRESGDILPLEKILASIRTDYPGKVLEVELERKSGRMVYEIEILSKQGIVYELYVDAATAKILKSKIDD